jgi:hypothetical protein
MESYLSILATAMRDYWSLRDKREEIDVEMAKSRQFIYATHNMLSDEDKAKFAEVFADAKETGLTESVRSSLMASGAWMTVAMVRDNLIETGFDFSRYESNPLASVSSTLKRLSSEDGIEVADVAGVTAYRYKRRVFGHPNAYADLFNPPDAGDTKNSRQTGEHKGAFFGGIPVEEPSRAKNK